MFANFGMFDLEPPPPPIALSADDAGLPPLFRALLGGDSARAIELLEHGADACEALPSCGATPLHAAGLGGCAADAVAALVAAGAPLEAQLTEPGVQLCYSVSGLLPTRAPAGSTPLTVACGRPHVATAEALLAAGAACEPPVLNNSQFVRFDAASPWHWLEKHSCSHEHKAAVNALRAHMLALMRQRHAAGTLALQPEQLLGWVGAAALRPPCSEELAAVVALPSAAGMLSEEQHRRLADVVVQSGDVAAVEALQAGPLRLQPLDPDGSMLRGTCITLRGEATVPMARALLQVRRLPGMRRALCCWLACTCDGAPVAQTQPCTVLLVLAAARYRHPSHHHQHNHRGPRECPAAGAAAVVGPAAAPRAPGKPRPTRCYVGWRVWHAKRRKAATAVGEISREGGQAGRRAARAADHRSPGVRRSLSAPYPTLPSPQYYDVCCPFYTLFRRCAAAWAACLRGGSCSRGISDGVSRLPSC